MPIMSRDLDMSFIEMYADGASRSNPGPSGIGVVIYKNKEEIYTISEYIGTKTNNEAEYLALLKGLSYLIGEGEKFVNCFLDSKLVVEQAKGNFAVKAKNLIPLNQDLKSLSSQFNEINFFHVPREQNARADELANEGIDNSKGSE